jgi:hypothetical protein
VADVIALSLCFCCCGAAVAVVDSESCLTDCRRAGVATDVDADVAGAASCEDDADCCGCCVAVSSGDKLPDVSSGMSALCGCCCDVAAFCGVGDVTGDGLVAAEDAVCCCCEGTALLVAIRRLDGICRNVGVGGDDTLVALLLMLLALCRDANVAV